MKNDPTNSDSLANLNATQADIGYGSRNIFVIRIFEGEWYLVHYNKTSASSALPGIYAELLILDEDNLKHVYYQDEVNVFDLLDKVYGIEKEDISNKNDAPKEFLDRMEELEKKFLGS
jgi:hypothetical protein